MSTTKNVTDSQIRALRAEAAQAGDDAQIVICDLALGETETGFLRQDRYGGGGFRLSRSEWERLDAMTADEARSECADVITATTAKKAAS